MNDLDLLKSHDPAAGDLPISGRDDLLRAIRTQRAPERRRRRRLAALGAGVGLATAGTGGLAYAVLGGQPPATALKVNCAAGVTQAEFDREAGFTAVMDVYSGDPVADCAAQYQRLGQPVPALRAYASGSVFIWVVPESWTVPATWDPLESGFRSDTSRLLLKQRVDDPIDGPGSGCRSTSVIREAVERELDALGLAGWTVAPVPGSTAADGQATCAFAIVDEGADEHVHLQSRPGDRPTFGDKGYLALVQRLRTDVAAPCLAMPDARAATARALADSGVTATVTASGAAAGRCTAIDLVPGGSLTIRLS